MAITYPKPEVAPRGQEFSMGAQPAENTSSANGGSLAAESQAFNMQVPSRVSPHILAPELPTGNGYGTGPTGADRQLVGGGELSTPNGGSLQDWQARLSFNDRRNV
jgi:hypothetical protein